MKQNEHAVAISEETSKTMERIDLDRKQRSKTKSDQVPRSMSLICGPLGAPP